MRDRKTGLCGKFALGWQPTARSCRKPDFARNIVRRMTHLRWERPSRAHTHELYNLQMRITLRNCSRFFSAMCLCLLTQSHFIAAQTSATEHSKPEAGKSIHQMFLDDQDDVPAGKPGGIAPITQAEIKARAKRGDD